MPTRKRLLLLFVLLMLLVALSLVSVASASPPQDGGGTLIETSSTVTGARQAGGNTIVNLTSTFVLTRTFTGTLVDDSRCVLKPNGQGTCHGDGIFTGTVCVDSDCSESTVFTKEVAKVDGASVAGRLIVVDGTGGLENLHGTVTFQGTAGIATYTTKVHFDPN